MVPDEVSRQVQGLFRPSPILLVGSGFSCGFGLPGMREVAQHLLTSMTPHAVSEDAFALWEAHKVGIGQDFEKGLDQIPSGASGREELTEEIRRLISGLIIARTANAEAEILNGQSPHLRAPARLLRRIFEGVPQNAECAPVITTNYDTLIELFCDFARLPIDTGFEGHRHRYFRENNIYRSTFRRENVLAKNEMLLRYRQLSNIRLIKPHGSITWHSTNQGPVEILYKVTDLSRAIVIPGPSKYEDSLITTLFDTIRTEMNNSIRNATGMMCVGFGFNDVHLQGVIRERLKNGMPMLILAKQFTHNIISLLLDHPNIIAIREDAAGSACHVDGQVYISDKPLWELDSFLDNFLE